MKAKEQNGSSSTRGGEENNRARGSFPYFQRKAELDAEQRRHELEMVVARQEMEANERHELEASEQERKGADRDTLLRI